MKGATIITFLIILSLSMVLLSFMVFIAYRYFENARINLREQGARQVALVIISEATDIYQKGFKINFLPENNSVVLLESKIDLPEKIAGENYYIEAVYSSGLINYIEFNESLKEKYSKSKISIVFENEKYYFDFPNMPIVFQGRASSKDVNMKYVRYRLGDEIKDAIIIGDQTNVIDVEILK